MTSQHAEDDEDGIGLLNEEREVKVEEAKQWKSWVVPTICLVIGFGMGALFHSDTVARSSSVGAGDGGGEHAHTEGVSHWTAFASFSLSEKFPWTEKKIFQPNPNFKKDLPNETDAVWEELMPLGRGFVEINWKGEPVIHDGSPANLTQTKNLIRRSFAVSISDPHIFYYLIGQLTRHWDHCFDYLRQAFMCTADTTLEELESNDKGEVTARVDGWGTEHICRDWEALKGWAQGHRGTDNGEID